MMMPIPTKEAPPTWRQLVCARTSIMGRYWCRNATEGLWVGILALSLPACATLGLTNIVGDYTALLFFALGTIAVVILGDTLVHQWRQALIEDMRELDQMMRYIRKAEKHRAEH